MPFYRNKALFLDRDGVINVDHGHVHRRESFEFKPGIFELCRAAEELGYLVIVVTNQAGIARGYYTESDFLDLMNWTIDQFKAERVKITKFYYCPYHPVFGVGKYKYDSPDRKPNPGMLLKAQADLNLDMASSILIGDQLSDIQAASAAGVGMPVLLASKYVPDDPPGSSCRVFTSLDDIRQNIFSSVG